MAYTIVKSDGTVLTTVADGTINTTATSIGLPGRNYAGYGQTVDTNFVHQLENFASATPPANPLRGQLWYNTNTSTMYVCPTDGESNAAAWTALTSVSGGSTTFGSINVTGNINSANLDVSNNANVSNTLTAMTLNVNSDANIGNATLSGTTTISNLQVTDITSGSATTNGNLTGVWTINGSAGGAKANAVVFNTGGIYINNSGNLFGIKTDKYMWANGDPVSFAGTYSNSNVALYLPTYAGNIGVAGGASIFNGNVITTGANTTTGVITGNWSLSTGSRLNATYADLAERHHVDREYAIGTVVKIGGTNEITEVNSSDEFNVIGVISDTAAYVMNSAAGDDRTHPPVGLIGRVKVRVVGPIAKGDRITVWDNGCATKSLSNNGFGWALETDTNENEKLVLCLIK